MRKRKLKQIADIQLRERLQRMGAPIYLGELKEED
jgi:hypothetical protein